MHKITAFGCSYTYGQALPDCHVAPNLPGPKPSNFSWPNQLALKLNVPCVNRGVSGFSNAAILDDILNYKFDVSDIVVVMWTFKIRDIKFKPQRNHENLGRWIPNWLEQQDTYDLAIKNLLHIHHGWHYLKSIGVKFYFLDPDYYQDLGAFTPCWMKNVKFVDLDFRKIEKISPMGLDNLHPGVKFHSIVADKLYQLIVNDD